MSDWLENRLIDFIFRAQPYTLPDNLYVALYATPIADDFGAAGASPPEELSGEGYARAVIPRSPLAWAGTQGVGFTEPTEPSWGTTGRTSNNVPIQFPAATGDWGTALWWAIHDAPTGGNMLYYGELLYPRTIYPGDVPVSFGPGDMAVWIDP
jgi:hypothetical protein